MSDYEAGDIVNVTVLGVKVDDDPDTFGQYFELSNGSYVFINPAANVNIEVVKKAEDPADDPISTVRSRGYSQFVKVADDAWVLIGGATRFSEEVSVYRNDHLEGSEIVKRGDL